ncbi:hypothetical protein [Chitinophaga filiformis]
MFSRICSYEEKNYSIGDNQLF